MTFYNSKNLLNEEVFSIMILFFELYEIVIDKNKLDINNKFLYYLNNNNK